MVNYKKIHLKDLDAKEFCVKLKKDFSKKLILEAKNKKGSLNNLAIILKKNCDSLKNNTIGSCSFKLSKYMNNEFYFPLDCLNKICKINEIKLKDIEDKIESLAIKYTKEPFKTNMPLIFNEDFSNVCETIRTEGYLSKELKRIELVNQDKRILNDFMSSLKKVGLDKEKITFCLYSKITIPNNIDKNNIKVMDITKKSFKNKTFSINLKELKNSKKLQIHLHDYDINWEDELKKYRIILPKKEFVCNIKIPKKGKIISKSEYKDISTALKIIARNTTFCKLINQIAGIQGGKKSAIIYLPRIIKNSPKSVVKKAFESVFNCEGSIGAHSVSIRSISTKYLEDWKEVLFKKFKINSYIANNKTRLSISHKDNLDKFYKTFKLLEEERKLVKKLTERKRILPPNTADEYYIKKVKEYKEITSRELANKVNKTQACTKRALLGLYKKGLIKRKILWQKGKIKCYSYFT